MLLLGFLLTLPFPVFVLTAKSMVVMTGSCCRKNGTDHTPISDPVQTLLLLTVTALFVHKTPQLFEQFGVMFADFFYHA